MKFLILLAALVPLATGYVIIPGKCPQIKSVENFEPEKLTTGEWHTITSFPHAIKEGYKCDKDKLTYHEDGFHGQYEVLQENTNAKEFFDYKATHVDGGKNAVFDLTFTLKDVPFKIRNVYILDTDYDNYLLYYTCNEQGDNSYRLAWLQAKNKRTLDEEHIKKVFKFFDQYELGSEHFQSFNQNDC